MRWPRLLAHAAAGVTLALLVALRPLPAAAPPQPEESGRSQRLQLEARDYAMGRSDAPLTLVEFTDYQCPYCRRFQAQTFPLLKKNYIDTGQLRFVVRDLPLEFHSAARPAAEAAHCAGEQGKFWEMHQALLSGEDALSEAGIDRRAHAVGLDLGRLHACMKANRYEAAIAHNIATADGLGIRGTPAFFLGRMVQGTLEGEVAEGAIPWTDFDATLKELLAARQP